MGERVAIVSLIKAGKLAEAIDRLNELESEILDKNETLCFQLKSQQLIELIRSGDLQNALIFAQQVSFETSSITGLIWHYRIWRREH